MRAAAAGAENMPLQLAFNEGDAEGAVAGSFFTCIMIC